MKKVICINNHDGHNFLTIGKEYNAEIDDNIYKIVNDQGWLSCYYETDFKESRLDKLLRLLDED